MRETGLTRYSEHIPGAERNWDWPARFDITDGVVGITQAPEDIDLQRILLSPRQVRELFKFVHPKGGKF